MDNDPLAEAFLRRQAEANFLIKKMESSVSNDSRSWFEILDEMKHAESSVSCWMDEPRRRSLIRWLSAGQVLS